ncbi:MAG: molybdate ABC transporter permease subunit [Planctomycetes bacterium]|nr:molybdate ABC transporter permease subunit [Planctomycetota bacterium]
MNADDLEAVLLSLRVAACVVVIGLPVSIALGYALVHSRGIVRWLLDTLVNLPLVLPPVVTGYVLLVLLGRHGWLGGWLENTLGVRLVFNWQGAALAALVVSLPLMVRAVRTAIELVDPRLEQAARTLGARPLDAFLSVVLPLAWPGVLAGAVLGFARSLGEFGATILVAGNIQGETRTIPLAVYTHMQQPDGLSAAWPLVGASIALCALSLAASQWLERRGPRLATARAARSTHES